MFKQIINMRSKRIITLFLITLFFVSFNNNLFSQDEKRLTTFTPNDYSKIILPPLDTLYAKMKTSPKSKIYDYRVLEEEVNLKTEKRKWLNYFNFSTAYQYGYLGGQSLIQGNIIPEYYQNSQSANNYYHIGVIVNLPFGDFIDRSNNIKKKKLRVNELEYEKEAFYDDQKEIIGQLYYSINQYLSLLQLSNENVKFAEIEFKICQEDFINGKVSSSTLSQTKKSQFEAYTAYETLKSQLNIAILQLEKICNYKFTQK